MGFNQMVLIAGDKFH